jgi:hypothetical protein
LHTLLRRLGALGQVLGLIQQCCLQRREQKSIFRRTGMPRRNKWHAPPPTSSLLRRCRHWRCMHWSATDREGPAGFDDTEKSAASASHRLLWRRKVGSARTRQTLTRGRAQCARAAAHEVANKAKVSYLHTRASKGYGTHSGTALALQCTL